MRFTRYVMPAMLFCTMVLAPVCASAAPSKEMLDLQRDMADLQQRVMELQKSAETKLTTLQTSVQQALDTANRTNSSVNSLNSGMMQTLQSALRGVNEQLSSVTGLAQTVKSVSEDVSNLQGSMRDMQVQLNKQGQVMSDILNQVKLLQVQAPAAPPPGVDTGSAAPGVAPPPPSGMTLFSKAALDQDAGRLDMALSGFKEFLRLYPDDANASGAQYNIGNIYYTKADLAEAVAAFDAAIERYPKSDTTPKAYYMKGMALKKQKNTAGAIASFKAAAAFPNSDDAEQAKTQLHSMGVSTAPVRKGR